MIPKGKRLIGDSGYKGEPEKISTTSREHSKEVKDFFGRAKERQETFDAMMKIFNILSRCFVHGKGAEDKDSRGKVMICTNNVIKHCFWKEWCIGHFYVLKNL